MGGDDGFRHEAKAAVHDYAERTGKGYLTRKGSAEYLSNELGRKVSVGSMHRMASDGTGPKYVMLLGHASYRREWLDEWIDGLAQEPKKRSLNPRMRVREGSRTAQAQEDAHTAGDAATHPARGRS